MSELIILLLAIVTAITVSLVGGVFLAFSSFIMQALRDVPANVGIRAMQEINVTVLRSLFLTAFFAAGIASTILIVLAVLNWKPSGSAWLIAGAVTYLAGCILVTIGRNVPLNNALAAADPSSSEGKAVWTHYLANWTAWNHIRTAACILSTLCFIVAALNRF